MKYLQRFLILENYNQKILVLKNNLVLIMVFENLIFLFFAILKNHEDCAPDDGGSQKKSFSKN